MQLVLVCPSDVNLLQYIKKRGIAIPSSCSGMGRCGKCRVRILASRQEYEISPVERKVFSEKELEEGWRLACLVKSRGPVRIEIPSYGHAEDDPCAEAEQDFSIMDSFMAEGLSAAGTKSGLPSEQGDMSGLSSELSDMSGLLTQQGDMSGLSSELSDTSGLLTQRGDMSGLYTQKEDISDIGLALDLGTTTLAMTLLDCRKGCILKTSSRLNSQRKYGADLMSRIRAAENGQLRELSSMLRRDIRELAESLLEDIRDSGEYRGKSCSMSIAGNTVMLHLLLGLPCMGLAVYPYHPLTLGGERLRWEHLFIEDGSCGSYHNEKKLQTDSCAGQKEGDTCRAGQAEGDTCRAGQAEEYRCCVVQAEKDRCCTGQAADEDCCAGQAEENDFRHWLSGTEVKLFKGFSSYVGADITAGIYALDLWHKGRTSLFIDLGTNGEMALILDDRILCTSAAAGPAFEGGCLSCGTGSVPGAICAVDPPFQYRTIGSQPPVGFCGTGAIETVAALLRSGLMDRRGKLDDRIREEGFHFPYQETKYGALQDSGKPDICSKTRCREENEGTADPEPAASRIRMTQDDIRQIQLAKGAIRAGIEILLQKASVSYEDLDRVYLAGGFGTLLDPQRAAEIGLLPQKLADVCRPVGNSSLAGAMKMLLQKDADAYVEEMASGAEEVLLAGEKGFEELFLKYMDF